MIVNSEQEGAARGLFGGLRVMGLREDRVKVIGQRQGIATTMVQRLREQVPGQHVGLQTDDMQDFYASLGFEHQPEFWSLVVGEWLENEANR